MVLGKSLLPTLSKPSQRCFCDFSCRTALCLPPLTAKLGMESLCTGHHCHTGTPAMLPAGSLAPGSSHMCPGTDKGLPNRMPGAQITLTLSHCLSGTV